MNTRPLADEIRPERLEDVVGQRHILGENGLLQRLLRRGTIPNMIFYGPSGTGKTTVANIIAKQTNRTLHHLNATTAGLADLRRVTDEVGTLMAPNGVLLYLDEIQYFNKKQQQSLLEFLENGKVTMIASTTENPYFYVYNAVLSRCTVFEFRPVSAQEVQPALLRGIRIMEQRSGLTARLDDGVLEYLAHTCGGDVRKGLNAVELLFHSAPVEGKTARLTLENATTVAQHAAMRYDREDDSHYDTLSALQKSIRGSDPDAALHYLARLLVAGDLLSPCRRLLVIASEDVGLAYPQAIAITKACVDAATQLGLPEARIPLAEATVLLATAPKSNSAINGIDAAMADIQAGRSGEIPDHLRDAHYEGAAKLGRGLTYQYPHAYPNHWVAQQYLPDELANAHYYTFGENKTEQAALQYWRRVKGGQ
ncbi:MAG: replication-associated recombination protein A [Oscillospiraceae bacterium]|nr:replication-associated recombination protein A [Oscillospiraceae bacterium]